MTAYYNEHDPVAAEWLRRLISAGHIAPGEVDERDIRDVAPAELVRFTQCHFFAGIGIWSLAARRAGWPDSRPIWTGSCPCQPFSKAGRGDGFDDERHLWPYWHWLIAQCRPDVITAEQVTGKDGLGWLDLVQDDLAGSGYASGAIDLSAAGFGMEWRGSAEAERLQRAIQFCPDPLVARHMASFADWADQNLAFGGFHIRNRIYVVGLGDGECSGLEGQREYGDRATRWEPQQAGSASPAGLARGLGHSDGGDASQGRQQHGGQQRSDPEHDGPMRDRGRRGDDQAGRGLGASKDHNSRGAFDWIFCRDGDWRPIGPGSFPLADATPGRMGQLRAYGNGLDFETATGFIAAVMEIIDERATL